MLKPFIPLFNQGAFLIFSSLVWGCAVTLEDGELGGEGVSRHRFVATSSRRGSTFPASLLIT